LAKKRVLSILFSINVVRVAPSSNSSNFILSCLLSGAAAADRLLNRASLSPRPGSSSMLRRRSTSGSRGWAGASVLGCRSADAARTWVAEDLARLVRCCSLSVVQDTGEEPSTRLAIGESTQSPSSAAAGIRTCT
jgi:hypothetical protein